jgi:hypothetical protein
MSSFNRDNLRSIVTPKDGGDNYLSFVDASYVGMVKALKPGNRYLVKQHEEFNLQIISFNVYRTVDLWWVIATYNGIINPLVEVKAGITLTMPTLESVNNYFRNVTEVKSAKTISI